MGRFQIRRLEQVGGPFTEFLVGVGLFLAVDLTLLASKLVTTADLGGPPEPPAQAGEDPDRAAHHHGDVRTAIPR